MSPDPRPIYKGRRMLVLLPAQLQSFVESVNLGDWVQAGYGTSSTTWRIGRVYEIGATETGCTLIRGRDCGGDFSVSALHADVVGVRKLSSTESATITSGQTCVE